MRKQISPDRYPAGVMYAPFCRTVAAPHEQWERDIKNIHDLGFTCMHGFAEWHNIEREKGHYDFSELDFLADLCAKYDITLLLNVATANGIGYYSPRWLMEEYRGCGLVTFDGECSSQQFTTYRFPCLDDEWYWAYAQRYLRALADHFANDSRIGGWVLWGEPSLSYKGKPICYCEHTIARFRKWLEKKYSSIDALNAAWSTDGPSGYADFSVVRPPVSPDPHCGSYASWQDWQAFSDENACSHIKRADHIFKERGAVQPTIAELFCYFGEGTYATIDAWKLAESADVVGVSDFQRPGFENSMMMTIADSISKHLGKDFFAVEILGGPKTFTQHTTGDFLTPSDEELCAEAAQAAGSGAKGYMYWCYRPRMTDREAGEFGMANARGVPLSRARVTGKTASVFASHSQELLGAYKKSDIAIFESTRIQRLCSADSAQRLYNSSIQGAYALCRDLHLNVDFINEDFIAEGKLQSYRVLLLPFAYMMDAETMQALQAFAEAGGILIADYPLGIKKTNGDAYYDLPGGNLRELFGIEIADSVYLDHSSRIRDNAFSIPTGTFVNQLEVRQEDGVTVTEQFGDAPLVVSHTVGKGRTCYLGFQFFFIYKKNPIGFYRDFFLKMTDSAVSPFALLHMTDGTENDVTMEYLTLPDQKHLLTVLHHEYESIAGEVLLPGDRTVTDFESGAPADCLKKDGKTVIPFSLGAWGYRMLCID